MEEWKKKKERKKERNKGRKEEWKKKKERKKERKEKEERKKGRKEERTTTFWKAIVRRLASFFYFLCHEANIEKRRIQVASFNSHVCWDTLY